MTTPSSSSSAYQPPGEPDRGVPDHGGSLSSVGDLLGEISSDLTTLVRQEIELAKAEVRQSVSRASKGGGMLGGAAFGGYMVMLFLSIALWWGLGNKLGRGWSGLVVAGIWAVIAIVLAVLGRAQLKAVTGLPKTTQTAKKIPDALKGNEASR